MPINLLIEYGRRLRGGLQLPPTPIPFVADPLDLTKEGDRRELLAVIDEVKPEVVFLDSARAMARVEENSSDEVGAFTRGFLMGELRDRRGLSVVLIGHPGKGGGSMRGSGDWEAGADSILSFEPFTPAGAKEPAFVEIIGVGRHPDVALTFKIDDLTRYGGDWVLREVDGTHGQDGGAADPAEARVIRWWDSNPGEHSQVTISKGAGGRTQENFNALINLMGRGWAVYRKGPRNSNLWSKTPAWPSVVPSCSRALTFQLFPIPLIRGNREQLKCMEKLGQLFRLREQLKRRSLDYHL